MPNLPALDSTEAVILLILGVLVGLIIVGIVSALRDGIGR